MKQLGSQPTFQTRTVHAGERRSPGDAQPVTTPIVPSVSYLYASAVQADAVLGGEQPGYIYSRYASPTAAAFERAVAELESAPCALATASGMAALHLALLAAGAGPQRGVVAALDLYGATYSLLNTVLGPLGVPVRFVDAGDLPGVRAALACSKPAALLVETLSNPLLKVADLPVLAQMAHESGAALLVDNTFATPYLCRPLEHGADFVIHSASKYLGGHGDVLAGVIVTHSVRYQRLFELNKLLGAGLGPFEAFLALRGLKTLALRMRQQCANAQALALWLAKQPHVARVHYPGLPSHPGHAVAARLFGGLGYGGVLAVEIQGAGKPEIFRFLDALRLCLPATSLGDVYTLVLYPLISSHRSLSPEERLRAGIPDNLVRFSAGIEALEDIQADISQALASLTRA